MHKYYSRLILLPLWLAVSLPCMALAQDLEISVQGNYLPERSPDARGSAAIAFSFRPYARESDGTTHNLDVSLFGRYAEGADEQRRHADVRELLYTTAWGAYEARFGVGRVFWGVAESAHIVDIVNQSDLLEDVDGEDKLGQPMLALSRYFFNGRIQGYVIPRFRSRVFGPTYDELAPAPIVEAETRYEDPQGERDVAYALRLSQRFGGLDIGLSYFQGTNREARLEPCAGRGTGRPGTETQANCNLDEAFNAGIDPVTDLFLSVTDLLGIGPSREELAEDFVAEAMADVVLVPFYDRITQVGLDAQWIVGPAAFKLESRYREQNGEAQVAGVAGVEYSLGGFFDDLVDVGALFEYLYDDRDLSRYLSLFEDDVFLGLRVLGNDIASSQLLGGVILDVDNGDQFWQLEASRRFGASLRGALELRLYEPGNEAQITDFLDDIDSLRLEFTWFL